MQVTKKSIEETAGGDCREWFVENFGEDAEVDAYAVIEKLREQKNIEPWIYWIFYTHKLSGLCEYFYSDGTIAVRCNFKNGNEDGLYECFYLNSIPKTRYTYKNGKLVGEYEQWNEKGEKIN